MRGLHEVKLVGKLFKRQRERENQGEGNKALSCIIPCHHGRNNVSCLGAEEALHHNVINANAFINMGASGQVQLQIQA